MARRRKSWGDPPAKTVFGSASAGIKAAIYTMTRQVVTRFHVEPVPTSELLKMLIREGDHETLLRARKLMGAQQRSVHADFMLKFDKAKGEWADKARIRLRVEGNDPEKILVPDYCAPTFWEGVVGVDTSKGNVQPGASFEHLTALEHGVKDLLEMALDWALVAALFDYFDGKPEQYKKSNVRFLWAGIMPLLRHGGESCQMAAAALSKVSDTGWCETPKDLYPAIRHANEVIARGQLLVDMGNPPSEPRMASGFAMPKVLCGPLRHPLWPHGDLSPNLFS